MEEFIVSARKYRPNSFETLVGQDNIAITLKNSILKEHLAHAYLFCGPRGVGKTSSARIFAKTINCLDPKENMDPCEICESCVSFNEGRSFSIHELDAASNNSVEDIRLLSEKVRIPPQLGKYSVYIIDEVHMLSSAAFNAFLKTLEEPPAHAIFILATTEKHKILPTILSRCQTFDFNRITIEGIIYNLNNIAEKEGIKIGEDALHIIAQKADGAMRDALTLFDQTVAFSGTDIKYEDVIKNLNVLDYEYYFKLISYVLESQHTDSLLLLDEILAKGFNALYFIGGLSSHLRDLLISKDEKSLKLLEIPKNIKINYFEQSKLCSINFLYNALNITTSCEASYRQSSNPRLHIEFAVIRLCQIMAPKPVEQPSNIVTAEAAKVEPKIESQKVESQKPEPKVEQIRSKFSIKGIAAIAEKSRISTKEEKTEAKNEIFNQEQLESAWQEMADAEKAMPRLASTLSQNKPLLQEDGSNIIFNVSNSVQKSWIEQHCLGRLQKFIQIKLNNDSIKIQIEITEVEEEDKTKLYMPDQKAKFLIENNPELNELRKDLKLEIK